MSKTKIDTLPLFAAARGGDETLRLRDGWAIDKSQFPQFAKIDDLSWKERSGVYAIIYKPTGRVEYVGKASSLIARTREHKRAKGRSSIYKRLRSAGVENFEFYAIYHEPRCRGDGYGEQQVRIIGVEADFIAKYGELMYNDKLSGGADTPELSARRSEISKAGAPLSKAKRIAALKITNAQPSVKAKRSAAARKFAAQPEEYARRCEFFRKISHLPRKFNNSPEARARRSEAQRARFAKPGAKDVLTKMAKRGWETRRLKQQEKDRRSGAATNSI